MNANDISTQTEERAAMRNDPDYARAIQIWNERAKAKSKITMLQSEILAVQERCERYTGELQSLAETVKPENKHLVFWT